MNIETEAALNNKFVENMNDAVFILDEKYNICDCNITAQNWYGYPKDEFLQLNLRDIRAPEERENIKKHMQVALKNEGATWETMHQRKDGSLFDVEVSSTPITSAKVRRFYHVVRNISERKRAERLIRASEERYHALIDFSPDTIFVHRDEKIIFINNAGLKLFGATDPNQLLGKDLYSLYPPERHDIVRERNRIMQETKQAVPLIEHTLCRLDGQSISVEATAKIIDFENKPAIYVIFRDITQRKKAEKELHYVSKYDVITDLPNRVMFEENLNIAMLASQEHNWKLAVLFIEVNNFNFINEAVGHANGDRLLKEVAGRLINLGYMRDKLARFSTDEFAIIIEDLASADDVTRDAEKIIAAMAKPFTIDSQKVNITVNIGVSVYPDNSQDRNSLLKSASMALNAAKEVGVEVFQFCSNEMAARANRRIQLEMGLREAIENNELFLNYQPIVDTRTNEIIGAESLIRWKKWDNLISPQEFIPIAEKTHLIIPIGEWILHTACQQAKQWQTINPNFIISVNISPVQFKHVDIVKLLANLLQQTGIPPASLKIEVTEGVLMDNVQQSINTLRKVKDMGINVSIDDFGTGYSSLNYLRHLPIDYLKIDQSFVRNMRSNKKDQAIVKTIIDLASNLGYKVIAEGVEDKEQKDMLLELGCYIVQGYYYSRPVADNEFNTLLATGSIQR